MTRNLRKILGLIALMLSVPPAATAQETSPAPVAGEAPAIVGAAAMAVAKGTPGTLGGPAAPLAIEKWVKGEPVDIAKGKGKNIFVVEFWATWCGPCIANIPHLTALQKKYKDAGVVFVSVSKEPVGTVEPFVKEKGDAMGYTIAVDDNGKTSEGYMKAFEQNGIPHAFVVDKTGAVVWHGHPYVGLDEVIGQVIAGKFDIEAARRADVAKALVPKYLVAVTFGDYEQARQMGEQMMRDTAGDARTMNELAWGIMTRRGIKKRDMDLAMRAAQAAYEATEGKDANVLDTYARALFETGKIKEAVQYQQNAIDLVPEGDMKKGLADTLATYEKALNKN